MILSPRGPFRLFSCPSCLLSVAFQGALAAVKAAAVAGSSVLELCKIGDTKIETAAAGVYRKAGKDGLKIEKGIAFPTCVSVNHVVCHASPLESDPKVTLAAGDVVKMCRLSLFF